MPTRLQKRPLIASILALFSSALFGRVMGTVYRVALVRVAGQDTIGIVQLAMPVYRIARSLATLGMPVAIAKITAERTEICGRPDLSAYRLGLSIMTYAALAGFLVQALFSNFWARQVLSDGRTEQAIVVLGVLLLPIAFTSALRGAVQGLQRQSFMAGADILEVLCRIPVTLVLVIWLAPYGSAWMAAGVAAGYIAGELASIILLKRGLHRHRSKPGTGGKRTKLAALPAHTLLKLSLPLMVTGVLNNAMSLLTVALIPRLLQTAGYTLFEATRAYGRLTGMAIPTLYMPMMLIYPVVAVALPELTRLAVQKGTVARCRLFWLLRRVFAGTLLVSAAVIPLLWYQGDWLARLLYADATIGELICPLALAVPFAFGGSVCTSVLYSLGNTVWTMVSSMAGNALRIIVVYMLAGRPEYGIMGVLWAYIADSTLTAILAGMGLGWTLLRHKAK